MFKPLPLIEAPPDAAHTPAMTTTPLHTWQLECWGPGWAWVGCEGASEGWGNVSLVPLRQRAVEVTWVWPDWVAGEVTPAESIHYQVEYGPLDAPYMLGRVGGNSRGVTLEEGVEPWTTYEVKLTTDAVANTSAIFFQIKESVTDTGPTVVRAEEVTLVLLVLVLWAVAILLFFHRWGKIRMLEPYQPEYKPLNHSPACPHAAPTPTQAQSRPSNPRPLLPRKSSSLCFTPSMLRAAHVPQSCRISVPQIDQTPVHRCSRAPSLSAAAAHTHHSPAHHPSSAHHARHRLRLASDSLDHGTTTAHHHAVEIARKVRSAENLRNYRISSTHGRGAEEACRGACHQLEATAGVHPHHLARRRSCQSHSLDLEHYRGTPTPLLQDMTPRGKSLDSTSVSSLRRSPTAGPSWAGGDPVCTTPELRVSPTPPDTSTPSAAAHHHSHHIILQRQETIDDALLPVPYATLMEEEMENEVSEV